MKTIQFNELARDVWHDAKEELPDDDRGVLICSPCGGVASASVQGHWPYITFTHWRELPAPPTPTPEIVPHSLEHWHDPMVERPEDGRKFVVMYSTRTIDWFIHKSPNWELVLWWTYAPETSR